MISPLASFSASCIVIASSAGCIKCVKGKLTISAASYSKICFAAGLAFFTKPSSPAMIIKSKEELKILFN
jgi:hypothetical protein